MTMTLAALAQAVGARLQGEAGLQVHGVASLLGAGQGEVAFLANPRLRRHLADTRASAVILSAQDAPHCPVAALIADNPHVIYARVAALLCPNPTPPPGIHPRAWIDPRAQIAPDAAIGPNSSIEAGAEIGPRAVVGPGCVVERQAVLGEDCRLVANVTICHGVTLGRRVLVHPGAVIGSDGFGLANDRGRWIKVPQLGGVLVGDDVEIGANTTIDRGALEDTVIEEGVKLDNLIQVAHNVRVGAHSAVAGCVGIAGSATIGRHCMLGGGVGVAGHLTIADGVQVTGMSLVAQSIPQAGVYSSGLTVEPNRLWNRISARLRALDDLARRLIALERKVSSDHQD
ncbi:MAG: UDP-3-O-(3-hydroxymyristoyl)glucosamine N-acyltransferase [Candidatus Competibacteraceae bacterium]|nr:UDP-3-O-(3-hydroxymyristoyl)glucosamine N-acyltransferase [Candidatus Competibacteraceae bacterium]